MSSLLARTPPALAGRRLPQPQRQRLVSVPVRRVVVRAESGKPGQYNEPGPRPAGAAHESLGPEKGAADPRFQAGAAGAMPASGGAMHTSATAAAGGGSSGQAARPRVSRRPKVDKEHTSVAGMVSDDEEMLPDDPIAMDEEVITDTKPFMRRLYRETAGTVDPYASEEELEDHGPPLAETVSDTDDLLPENPIDLDEEMMIPQKPSIRGVYNELGQS